MKYKIVSLTRSYLEKMGVQFITTRQLYKLLKRVWCDHEFAQVLNEFDAPTFVATEKAYFSQNLKKISRKGGSCSYAGHDSIADLMNSLTAEMYYDMRVIILPPFSQIPMTHKEIRHLLQLCLKDYSLYSGSSNSNNKSSGGVGGTNDSTELLDRNSDGCDDSSMYAEPIGPRGVDWFDVHTLTMKKGKLKQYLQGGKSVMRQKIIIPKVQALRAQITCDFRIHPTEMVIPRKFAPELKMDSYPLFCTKQGPQMRALPSDVCQIAKRDPAIHQASISYIDRVQFVDSDLLIVSPLTMVHKNADIDGDTYTLYPIHSKTARREADCLIHPARNMYMKDTARLAFSQMHILYLHNHLHLLEPVYAKIGLELQAEELVKIEQSAFHREIYKKYFNVSLTPEQFQMYCVPTGRILKQIARIIYLSRGSRECYNFFINANDLVVRLAKEYVYYVGLDLTCPALLCITASGAKSSLELYTTLLDKLKTIDGTYKVKPLLNTVRFDHIRYQNVIGDMAVSARLVPKNGYNWYKMDLEWKNVQIGQYGNVYYCKKFLTNLIESMSPNLLAKLMIPPPSAKPLEITPHLIEKLKYYHTETSKRKLVADHYNKDKKRFKMQYDYKGSPIKLGKRKRGSCAINNIGGDEG